MPTTLSGLGLRLTTAAYAAALGGHLMAKAPKVPKAPYRPADEREADEARERERQRLKRRQGAAATLLSEQPQATVTNGAPSGAKMLGGGMGGGMSGGGYA